MMAAKEGSGSGALGDAQAVFDRRHLRHPWLRALSDLEKKEVTRRMVARNWRMDHRVSVEREDRVLERESAQDEADGATWLGRRRRDFVESLCLPAEASPTGRRSEYVAEVNSNNAIPRRTLPGHEQLVHAASLNKILGRLTSGEFVGAVDLRLRFNELTGAELPARVPGSGLDREAGLGSVDGIVESTSAMGGEAVRELAGALCEALGPSEPPWWACFAQEVMEPLQRGDGTGLCRKLGLGHLNAGEWLLVWRYEVREIYGRHPDLGLVRPTVVEAGDSPFHFPSPPGYRYGITMALEDAATADCREVLHPPLRGDTAVETSTGAFLRIEQPPLLDYDHLENLRRQHGRRLDDSDLTPDTAGWLGRHPL